MTVKTKGASVQIFKIFRWKIKLNDRKQGMTVG